MRPAEVGWGNGWTTLINAVIISPWEHKAGRHEVGGTSGAQLSLCSREQMLVFSIVGGILALIRGVSFGLVVGIVFNLLFWYWIAVGAWRRTTWSLSRHNS